MEGKNTQSGEDRGRKADRQELSEPVLLRAYPICHVRSPGPALTIRVETGLSLQSQGRQDRAAMSSKTLVSFERDQRKPQRNVSRVLERTRGRSGEQRNASEPRSTSTRQLMH